MRKQLHVMIFCSCYNVHGEGKNAPRHVTFTLNDLYFFRAFTLLLLTSAYSWVMYSVNIKCALI